MTRLNINQSSYLNLAAGVRARMCVLKNAAAYTNAPDVLLPPSMRFADWRAARVETFATITPELSQGFNVETRWAWGKSTEVRTPVWTTFSGEQFRNEKYADDVEGGPDHRGWFADADCSQTVRGIVGRLTHDRFIAGYAMSETGERVYLARVFDRERDAAQAGDEEARKYAEEEKEHSERWQAAHDLAEEIKTRENRVSELFALRNNPRFRDAARSELADVCDELRTKRDELKNDFSDIEI